MHKILFLFVFTVWSIFSYGQLKKSVLDEKPVSESILVDTKYRSVNPIVYRDFSENMQEAFQEILISEYKKANVTGLSLAVITKNDEWKSTVGISSIEDTLNPQMTFGMGSISKSITAATVLKLQEEGLLSIYDSISKYIGFFKDIDSSITIKQLLNHSSGIYNVTDNPKFVPAINQDFNKIWNPRDVIDSFLLKPYFKPGKGWKYSNTNFILAGMIIEAVTNDKYHNVVRAKVLNPAGLDSIYLKPFETNNLNFVHFWSDLNNDGKSQDIQSIGITLNSLFSGAWAAGAYVARTIDVAKWIQAITLGDVLNDNSKIELYKDAISLGNNIFYALGIIYVKGAVGGKSIIGHDGNIGYTSSCYTFPIYDLTIAVQCNDGNVQGDLLNGIINKVFVKFLQISTSVIDENYDTDDLVLYPNPVSQNLIIDLKNSSLVKERLQIFNEVGEMIYINKNIEANMISIDVSDFPKGVYYLKLDKQKVKTFLKE